MLDRDARLDDFLSRVAAETREIQELEQQLTDGQILAKDLLQKDLAGILAGLEEYLGGLCLKVAHLQAENESLQRHLEDAERHRRRLEDEARAHAQEAALRQAALRTEARLLKSQKAGLEAELRELREELAPRRRSRSGVEQNPQQLDRHRRAQLEDGVSSYRRLGQKSAKDRQRVTQLEEDVNRYRQREGDGKRAVQTESQAAALALSGGTSAGGGARCPSRGASGKAPHRANGSVLHLCAEVACVERTLHKRRAELREADRRLMHARQCFHSNQAASQHSATNLKRMEVRLRVLQDEEAELGKRTRVEHQRLRPVEAVLRGREAESRELGATGHMAAHECQSVDKFWHHKMAATTTKQSQSG
ncbi:uncharacterized protein LOC144049456 isoform X2 [Vanacampus margaritifer]